MELSDEKIWLYGLFVACPEGTSLKNCPFKKYRSLPDTQKITLLENFTDKKVDEIIKHHHKCLLNRV